MQPIVCFDFDKPLKPQLILFFLSMLKEEILVSQKSKLKKNFFYRTKSLETRSFRGLSHDTMTKLAPSVTSDPRPAPTFFSIVATQFHW